MKLLILTDEDGRGSVILYEYPARSCKECIRYDKNDNRCNSKIDNYGSVILKSIEPSVRIKRCNLCHMILDKIAKKFRFYPSSRLIIKLVVESRFSPYVVLFIAKFYKSNEEL